MKIDKWWRKTMKSVLNPEENKRLSMWQDRYENAKTKYADNLEAMKMWDNYYEGSRKVMNAKKNGYAQKEAYNIRNITFELVETETESAVPRPKVTAMHEEDIPKARKIENYLNNKIVDLKLRVLNDQQERTTYIQGGSFSLVEWDNKLGTHCTIGDLVVTNVHPRQVIPQPGMTEIEQMDYFFIRTPQTKEYIKRRFNKEVKHEEETDKEIRDGVDSEDIVTVVTCYYKNQDNGIGLYRWCGDTELENIEDYQERRITVCKKCGKVKTGDVCECGSKSFEETKAQFDVITIFNEVTEMDAFGNLVTREVSQDIQVPYYKPEVFPLILRKNISRDRRLLGFSDVEVIADQQDAIKKIGSKVHEKVLKGGSYLTLPEGVPLETTDEELKIIRVDNPQQKNLIDVVTVQADTTQDRMLLELNYQHAKSSLGITDSYQGKYDSSATSGTAKQYAINQAAGRLESKRVMKNESYARLYEMMFKFTLAYGDDPIPINYQSTNGERVYEHFDKKDFLKQDSDGQYYWNDEFIFDIDPTSNIMTNREAMWNQNDIKLQSGAYGQLGDDNTISLYWLEQELSGYPNAGEVKQVIDERIAKNEQQQQQMSMLAQQMQGGTTNEMPGM